VLRGDFFETTRWTVTFLPMILAARGRGLVKLIEGISKGDPWAIGIAAVVGVAVVGYGVYRMVSDRA